MTEEIRLSVSKTKCFEQCKKQFYFTYVQKIPRISQDYHILGQFCHKILEDFHRTYINGSDVPYNVTMATCFNNAKVEYKDGMTKEMIKECYDIINRYLKMVTEEKDNPNAPKILDVEQNFYLNVSDNVILNGMIDRVQLDADGVLHIADYKSTKNKKYLNGDWFQLLTYAYVILQEKPDLKKIRASYILLRHNFEYMTVEFGPDEILAIKDKYLKYASDILAETEYLPTTSNLCAFCQHVLLCPEGMVKSGKTNTFGEISW